MSHSTSLETIISYIDKNNTSALEKALQIDAKHINDYYNMDRDSGLEVKMTPLHFAVKQKSPASISVLLQYGANPKMELMTPEDKSLPITALKLAKGERDVALKHNEMADATIYEEIIQIINNFASKSPRKDDISGPPPPTATATVEIHRLSLKVSQNQLAIKDMERENARLKTELENLKQDMAHIKKWVDKWIYDSPPGGGEKKSSKSSKSSTSTSASTSRTAESRARKKARGDNGEESPPVKKAARSRPQSVTVTRTSKGEDMLENPHKKEKSPSSDALMGSQKNDRHRKSPARVETVSGTSRPRNEKDKDQAVSGKHKRSPPRRETVGGKEKRKEEKTK